MKEQALLTEVVPYDIPLQYRTHSAVGSKHVTPSLRRRA